jgi:hypothetical protein
MLDLFAIRVALLNPKTLDGSFMMSEGWSEVEKRMGQGGDDGNGMSLIEDK